MLKIAGQSLTKLVDAVCGLPLAKDEQVSSQFLVPPGLLVCVKWRGSRNDLHLTV